ncbi:hypothetical protein CTI16_07240 [Prevotella intermedia]|jgi:glycoside hydrolase family 19|uniref:Uncharacterized protein n=1 Tax=Prevotella intermedia TaxID=28131 RepID=A0A2G9IHW2_PREIN|nr:hypothetical protein [Prevotella intermedia]PIK18874.1 hypothetical protein CTI16_07240 [Prevotella intermedia]PIN29357.1 hypothetical protein CUC04_08180 [Prevotella intermedia]
MAQIRITSPQAVGSVTIEAIIPDIVTYHIYWDGRIEKHIPKVIQKGYENKYKYVYHDEQEQEYEIGLLNYFTTTAMGSGNIPIKGKNAELIDIREFRGYISPNVKVRFSTINSSSGRYYINPSCLASLFGTMAILNIDYLGFNGFSDKLGRSIGGSKSHINGERGDLRYLSKNRNGEAILLQSSSFDYEMQVKFCNTLHLFGWAANGKHFMLSEKFIYKEKTTLLPYCHHYRTENVRHNNHLHLQGFNFNQIKEIKL